MSYTINSNLASQQIQQHLAKATDRLINSMQSLNTGLRIHKPMDDPSGLAISNRQAAKIRACNQINRNLNDGITYAQVADSALSLTIQLLQRGQELAIQAVNASLTDTDRQAIHLEFQHIKNQIDQIANDTEIFGKYPLKNNIQSITTTRTTTKYNLQEKIIDVEKISTNVVQSNIPNIKTKYTNDAQTRQISGINPLGAIPAGSENVTIWIDSFGADDDIELFTANGEHLAGTPLNDPVWASHGINTAQNIKDALFTAANGYVSDAIYSAANLNAGGMTTDKDMTFHNTGDRHPSGYYQESITIDKATENILVAVVGSGQHDFKLSYSSMPDELPPTIETKTITVPETIMVTVPETVEESVTETIKEEDVMITTSTHPLNEDNYVRIPKTGADTATLKMADASLETREQAEKTMKSLTLSMETVLAYQAMYGNKMNAMESLGKVVMEARFALSSAHARITESDVAEESAKLASASIVQKAGTAILAQANQQPHFAMQLLDMENGKLMSLSETLRARSGTP
ncbi:MAG: hypothetical protein HQM03_21390 [Magnetococcales bacterium]|nr:hypothetical protein [Magnetococcales bacterium]